MRDLLNFALLLLAATATGADSSVEKSSKMELHAGGTVLPYVLKSPTARDTKRYTLLNTDKHDNDESMALDKELISLEAEDNRPSNSQTKAGNLWDRIALYTTRQPTQVQMPFVGNDPWYRYNPPTQACNPHCHSAVIAAVTLPFALLMALNFGVISYVLLGALGSLHRLPTFAPAFSDYGYGSTYNGHYRTDEALNIERH